MAKRILCICNTYYQLITVIQLKLSFFKNDKMDVFVSDHSNRAAEVVERLQQENLFERVTLFSTKDVVYKHNGKAKKLMQIIGLAFGCPEYKHLPQYDLFLYNNLEIATAAMYISCLKQNPYLSCSRFEEGLISYITPNSTQNKCLLSGRIKYLYYIRKLLGDKKFLNSIEDFYCFYPQYYHGAGKPVKIPDISNNATELKKILSAVFCLTSNQLNYPQKYIYFASVGDCEGGKPIGEIKVAKQIRDLVGEENLLIKTHPRDNTNAFEKAGFTVDKSSSIPWEVIQLNYDFSQHVFLTATSGSVLSVNLMLENAVTTYFLYPLCDLSENPTAKKVADSLTFLLDTIKEEIPNIQTLSDLNPIEQKSNGCLYS